MQDLCTKHTHTYLIDQYLDLLIKQYNTGEKRNKNKQYDQLSNKIRSMRDKEQNLTYKKTYQKLIKKLITIPSRTHDNRYIRIQYLRYADHFIIAIEGSYTLAKTILQNIQSWIQENLSLKLDLKKTKIIKYSSSPFKLLGYSIMAPYSISSLKEANNIKKPIQLIKLSGRTISKRKKLRIRFFMDYEKILNKLKDNGFIKKRMKHNNHKQLVYRGTSKKDLINLKHDHILKYYNSIIRSIYYNYNFVHNMNQLKYICYLLKESCCLTLTRKFKLKTIAATYRKFGKSLSCNILFRKNQHFKQTISIFNPQDFKRKSILDTNFNKDPIKQLEIIRPNKVY